MVFYVLVFCGIKHFMNTQTVEMKIPSIGIQYSLGTTYLPYPDYTKQLNLGKFERHEPIEIKGGKAYEVTKRIFDFSFSLLAIIVLSPLFLILSILVKTTSKGNVIYKDYRIGMDGKKIAVLKFRSMYSDAEKNIRKFLTAEQLEKWTLERKIDNDPRVTKVGKFLRKTSLDELPQLFNILKGELSFVGPRPITRIELEENYTRYQKKCLLSVKPGLTGYWQVYGRSNVEYKTGERQKEELAYLPKRSVFFDLKLLFLTIPAVMKHQGAK